MIENKIYTSFEMMREGIYTGDFHRMEEPCQVIGRLVLKAESREGIIRAFFVLEDGRKIFTPVFWWQQYLDLIETPIGTKFRLTYVKNPKGVHLGKAEKI